MTSTKKNKVLVIGGGISGLCTAVEMAQFGYEVTILEKEPSLGGRVAKMYQYFPKLCPPYCGLEIYYKRIRSNPDIKYISMAQVQKIEKNNELYSVSVEVSPTCVNEKCTACGECVADCPAERPSSYNYGLNTSKAIYLPHEMALPYKYAIDKEACISCGACVEACKYQAIDLDMQTKQLELKADVVVYATGWKPYAAENIDNLNYGSSDNIITNVVMERLAAPNGPTAGQILRPSDNKKVESVAFIQCAGSRDENHLPYCSSVCCMASLKQADYVRAFNPEAQISLFYIDLRTPGRYEDFLKKSEQDDKLKLIKGKVADITADPATGDLTILAEDVFSGKKHRQTVNMAVMATGMQPSLTGEELPLDINRDKFGFLSSDRNDGIFYVGSCKKPTDVSNCIKDSSATALKAIKYLRKRG